MALPSQTSIAQIDPDRAVFHVLTVDQVIGRSTTDASFNAQLTLGIAVLALVQASVGLLDASVFAAVARILLGVASVACLASAWRVPRLDRWLYGENKGVDCENLRRS
jgi:hypothetical protein